MRRYKKSILITWIILIAGYAQLPAQHTFSLRIALEEEFDEVIVEVQKSWFLVERGELSFRGTWERIAGEINIAGQIPGHSEMVLLRIRDDDKNHFTLPFVIDSGKNQIDLYVDGVGGIPTIRYHSTARTANKIYAELRELGDRYLRLYGDSIETLEGGHIFALNRIDKIHELSAEKIKLLTTRPPTYFTLVTMLDLFRRSHTADHVQAMLAVIQQLPDTLRGTALGKELSRSFQQELNAVRNTRIGTPAPVFTVEDAQGRAFTNASFPGRPYVIAFSATWCVPCKVYEKELKALYDRYSPLGLEVVYFNLHNDDKAWHGHIRAAGLDWINVSERVEMHRSEIARTFNVTAIPNYIVVDRDGNQVYNDKISGDRSFSGLEDAIMKAIDVKKCPY